LGADSAELADLFYSLESRSDVARLLDVSDRELNYFIYRVPLEERYTRFEIPKRAGGIRVIHAPANSLKLIQRKLNQVLQSVYRAKQAAHGFVPHRSIVTNASPHVQKRHVLNVDLLDFFPSINFGRVRGLFMAKPYSRNPEVSTTLAQICCFDNGLPQGAPTSPIVSNMICARMDSQLQHLARANRCTYTRYADDITFSTSRPTLPKGLAYLSDSEGRLVLGDELRALIELNGFQINPGKTRLQPRSRRQEVTGLTVNVFANVRRSYIRDIRSTLHAWEAFGLAAAEQRYRMIHARRHPEDSRDDVSLIRVVQGKLNFLKMVRGENHRAYVTLASWFSRLSPDDGPAPRTAPKTLPRATIYTEGKSDWMHLKAALAGLQAIGSVKELDIEFHEFGDERSMGDGELLKICSVFSRSPQPKPVIAIFDRDKPATMANATDKRGDFKDWGNGVYSFVLPVPAHRPNMQDICIELYYHDKDLKRKDGSGRRLYLSDEFNPRNNAHTSLAGIYTTSSAVRRPRGVAIIDSGVHDSTGENIALSKAKFAELIANHDAHFHDVDFSGFIDVFAVVSRLLSLSG
jgi:RNA-directed DNA polymerase